MNYRVIQSGTFLRWLKGLRDKRAHQMASEFL